MLAALLTSALANDCAGKSCGDCTTAARGINKCVFRADTNECLTGMDAFQAWGADTNLLSQMKFENAQCARSGREQFLRGVIDMRLARSADADCQAALTGYDHCEDCIAAGCIYNDNGSCKTMASALMDFHGKADISHFAFSQCPASGKRSLVDDSTELQARGVAFLSAMARSGCTGKPCGDCAGDSNCAFFKGTNGGCMPRMSAMQMYWMAKDGEMKDMANYALHSGECARRSVADDIQRFSRLLMERDTQPNKRNKPEWVGEKCESDEDCPSNWWCGSYSLGFMRDFYCLDARRGVEERSLGVEGRGVSKRTSCMLGCFADNGNNADAYDLCQAKCPATRSVARAIRGERRTSNWCASRCSSATDSPFGCDCSECAAGGRQNLAGRY